MDMLRVQMEGTLNPEDKKRVRSEMKDMSKLSTEIARSIGSFLKHQKSLIEKENSQPGGGVTKQIRANLYAAHTKSFHEAMQEYNRATIAFKDAVNDRTKRQLRYALDEKFSDEDIDKIIENGEAEKVLQQEVLTDDMESTLDNIKDRHEDVLALEKQVQEVFELFQDLAVIVDEHQDTMDSIEGRIHNSKNYVEHAHKDLVQAEDYLDKANKYKCIIVGVIMFTMCCILLPIIL